MRLGVLYTQPGPSFDTILVVRHQIRHKEPISTAESVGSFECTAALLAVEGRSWQPVFIIQPFDSAKFDQRFEEVFKPALKRAGLKPYRVDQDPGVEIPIEAIEREIVRADICLADISTNNPNVWYELGYALAANRPVVLICSHDRGAKFPFDIQHRDCLFGTGPIPRVTLRNSRMKSLREPRHYSQKPPH